MWCSAVGLGVPELIIRDRPIIWELIGPLSKVCYKTSIGQGSIIVSLVKIQINVPSSITQIFALSLINNKKQVLSNQIT